MIPVALNLCNDTLSRPSPDIQDAHCKKKKKRKTKRVDATNDTQQSSDNHPPS